MIQVTDQEIIEASNTSQSASEAARKLGINYKTYKKHAIDLGVFNTNQSGTGCKKDRPRKHTMLDTALDIQTEEVAYWIGFLAADGNVLENRIQIMLAEKDIKILSRFKQFLQCDYDILRTKVKYQGGFKPACYIAVRSSHMVDTLANYGIVERKSYKDIDFMSKIQPEYRTAFLMGMIDGDGSISDGRIPIISIATNRLTADSISKYLLTLGINSSISTRESLYIMSISRDNCRRLCRMYIDFNNRVRLLERKLMKAISIVGIANI